MSKVIVFLANGFEEIEGLTVVDLLRRADITVETVSISDSLTVTGAHNISVLADTLISDAALSDGDMVVLPGGMPGTLHLANCKQVTDTVTEYFKTGKRVAAICAAPSILGDLGILKGKIACCYPGFEDRLTDAAVTGNEVEQDGTVTTSQGVGTAIPFALSLIEQLKDKNTADTIKKSIMFKH